MRITVLNKNLDVAGFTSTYKKAVFCEKFREVADFSIVTYQTKENIEMFVPMNFVYYNYQLYLIERVKTDGQYIYVSGRSALVFLYDKEIISASYNDLPPRIIASLVRDATMSPPITFSPLCEVYYGEESANVAFRNTNVMKEVENICRVYECGFNTNYLPNTKRFIFQPVYPRWRTAYQLETDRELFSDKLYQYEELKTDIDISEYKNVAKVYSINANGNTFVKTVDQSYGEVQRILNVNMTGVLPEEDQDLMFPFYGRNELKKHKKRGVYKFVWTGTMRFALGDICSFFNSEFSIESICLIEERTTVIEDGEKKIVLTLQER